MYGEYQIRQHNIEVEYQNTLQSIYKKYYSSTKDAYSTVHEQGVQQVQDKFDKFFSKISCYDAMLHLTRLNLMPIGDSSSSSLYNSNPPFLCNKNCVREVMAFFADLEATQVLGPDTLSLAGGISSTVIGEVTTTSHTTVNGETTADDPYTSEKTVLYYEASKRMEEDYENENVLKDEADSIVIQVETGNESSKGRIKSISADVFIEVSIRASDENEIKKLYHARVDFSKEEDINGREFTESQQAYNEGRKQLADFDKKYAEQRKKLDESIYKKRLELEKSYNDSVAEIEKKLNEDIAKKQQGLMQEVDSILEDYNARIASESDTSKVISLQAEAKTKAQQAKTRVNNEIVTLENDAAKEKRDAYNDFYEKRQQYYNQINKEESELGSRYSSDRSNLYTNIRNSLPNTNSGSRLELWSVDIADLMNRCLETPAVKINQDTKYGSVLVQVKIHKIENFAMRCDWEYLTGYDFTEYYNIAKEHDELIKGYISMPEIEV